DRRRDVDVRRQRHRHRRRGQQGQAARDQAARARAGARQGGRGGGGGEEGAGGGGQLLQVQRPGAHVPAQDGVGLPAHPRGRGGDRQAHRGRREGTARRRAALLDRQQGDQPERRPAAERQEAPPRG